MGHRRLVQRIDLNRKSRRLCVLFVFLLVIVLAFNSTGATRLGVLDTGDFTVGLSSNTLNVNQGSTGTTTITVTSLVNFSGPVNVAVSGLPSGVSAAVATNPLTPPKGSSASSTLVIGVGGTVAATNYPLIVSGTNGTLTHSTVLTLTVTSSGPSPDFTITLSPSSITIPESVSATATATITSIGSFSSSVSLSASGVPSGLILTFETNPIVPPAGSSVNTAISLILQPWVAPGPYQIKVTGTSESLTHSTNLGLFIVPMGDYQLRVNPSTVSLTQGTSASTTITLTSYNGFSSRIQLSAFWVGLTPYGVSVSTPSTIPPQNFGAASLTLTIAASTTASVGTYTLRVTSIGGPAPQSADISVQVNSVQVNSATQDFVITTYSTSVTIVQGSQNSVMVTVQSLGTFSSPVTLTTSGAPAGVSLGFVTNSLTPTPGGIVSSMMTITAGTSVPAGTYAIIITGLSASTLHTTSLSLIVTSAATSDFSLSSSRSAIAITQGQSGTDTISVNSHAGFSSPIILSASWLSTSPAGVTLNIPSPIIPAPNTEASTTLTITTTGSASTGNFTVRVEGISGTLLDFVDIAVDVKAPQCVIATATYGSELSPEVRFLRDFRDNMILKTSVGSNFMLAFNAWYYSFSPTVAQSITKDSAVKTAMKFVLYPLISILKLGASTFNVIPTNAEASAVISGLIISSLIGASYIALPLTFILARTRKARVGAKRLERPTAAVVVAGLVTLTLAEFAGGPSIALVLVASAVVLGTITLSSLLTSRLVLRALSVISRKF